MTFMMCEYHTSEFYLDDKNRLQYEDAHAIIDSVFEAIEVAQYNVSMVKEGLDVGGNMYRGSILVYPRHRPDLVLRREPPLVIYISESDTTILEYAGRIETSRYTIPTIDLSHNRPYVTGTSSEVKELHIGDWTFPVVFCSMEPCSDCGCFMDCDRGGYRI